MLINLTKAITGATSASPGVCTIQYQYNTGKAEIFITFLCLPEADNVEAYYTHLNIKSTNPHLINN